MTEEYTYTLQIPKERIAVLIGKKGEVKKELESSTNTIIKINSQEGDVEITGNDALKLYTAREIVRAISRGFSPQDAFYLLKTDYGLEVVDMKRLIGKSKSTIIRLKGRVIGEKGKARKEIESLTETSISIYGKTIGIIGKVGNVAIARHAIEMLLGGSTHATVYSYLEKQRRIITVTEHDIKEYIK